MSLNRRSSLVSQLVIANKNGAYVSGNQIGVPVEVKNAVENSGGVGTLMSIVVLDPAHQNSALDILVFSQQPGTPGADAGAVAVAAGDLPFLLGTVNVPTTAYATLGTPSTGTVLNVNLKVQATKSTYPQSNSSLWLLVVARGTPNYAAANALKLQIGIDRD